MVKPARSSLWLPCGFSVKPLNRSSIRASSLPITIRSILIFGKKPSKSTFPHLIFTEIDLVHARPDQSPSSHPLQSLHQMPINGSYCSLKAEPDGVRLAVEAHATGAEWQTNSREVNTTGLMLIRMSLKSWMSEKNTVLSYTFSIELARLGVIEVYLRTDF